MIKDKFLRQFTSRKRQLKSEYHLNSIKQGEKVPLCDFIILFNKEALEVKDVSPNMILFFLMEGLKPSFFKQELTGNKPLNMEELKDRARFWIRIEEQSKASRDPISLQVKAEGKSANKGSNQRGSFDSKFKEKGPRGTFNSYTPLLTTSAKLYKEVMNTELTEHPPAMRSQSQDRKKWCAYHRDHGHYTNECIQLKDAIERLV
jgi:hypothetical protein